MEGLPNVLFERFIQSTVGHAIHLLDSAGLIASANSGAGRIHGTAAEELLGTHFSAYYMPQDQAAGRPDADLRAAAAGSLRTEAWRLRKNGEKYWASVVLEALRDERGVVVGYAEVIQDDSERQDVALRAEAARESAVQASRLEALGQLTGGLAHDFNNILQGMLGSLQLAQRRVALGEQDKAQRLIDAGIGAGRRAAGLTHRLLAFARRLSLDPKPVDVNRLLVSLEDMLKRTMGESVAVEFSLTAGLAPALCDPSQLESALVSLAVNAREAMAGGGTLAILTRRVVFDDSAEAARNDLAPGAYICLTVCDTGTGMPADVLDRAFDPFFTTKPTGYGTGLGLSMVHGFAKQSDGAVAIRSGMGEGTQVQLCLPEFAETLAQDWNENGSRLGAAGGHEFVLVVDDDDMVRDLVTQTLNESGYRVRGAPDASVALGMMRSGPMPDLLLTDVGLPGLNGRQLADAARELQAGLKVLFITGYAANAVVGGGAALAPGMSVLMKPFDVGTLSEKVRSMLDCG